MKMSKGFLAGLALAMAAIALLTVGLVLMVARDRNNLRHERDAVRVELTAQRRQLDVASVIVEKMVIRGSVIGSMRVLSSPVEKRLLPKGSLLLYVGASPRQEKYFWTDFFWAIDPMGEKVTLFRGSSQPIKTGKFPEDFRDELSKLSR